MFCYLGLLMSADGKLDKHVAMLHGKSQKSLGLLKRYTYRYKVPLTVILQLFDTLISSVLMYACELWGFSECITLERVQTQFLKTQLQLKLTTNDCMVHVLSNHIPLIYVRYYRIIKYWVKLTNP